MSNTYFYYWNTGDAFEGIKKSVKQYRFIVNTDIFLVSEKIWNVLYVGAIFIYRRLPTINEYIYHPMFIIDVCNFTDIYFLT